MRGPADTAWSLEPLGSALPALLWAVTLCLVLKPPLGPSHCPFGEQEWGREEQKGPPLPVCDRQPPDISARPVCPPAPRPPIHN